MDTIHTDEAMLGLEQLEIFKSEGADPTRVIIGHSGDTANLQYHASIMDQGAYLGCDRFGLELILPSEIRLFRQFDTGTAHWGRNILLFDNTVVDA